MKKVMLIACFILGVFVPSKGQTAQQFKLLGDEAYRTLNYHSAVNFYEAALILEKENPEVLFNLAESYRHLFHYSAAYKMYLELWNTYRKDYPQTGFWVAMMLKSQERYEEAKTMFKDYLSYGAVESIHESGQRAKLEISACDSAMVMIADQPDLVIRNFSEVNTPWSEFNPVAIGDSIFVFSALRPLIQTDNPLLASGDYSTQIYIASYGISGLKKPEPMHPNINGKDGHTANISFTEDGNRAYFNRCTYRNYKLRCDVWFSELKGSQWSKARKLPAPLNHNDYTTTQPFVTIDSVSGNDLLYFSSDRHGGMGELDLWFCIVKDGTPEMPVNLGSIINTPGNEITPFYHAETGTLYFSSDWHYGLGGFDVFSAKGAMSSWKTPKNPGSPVNTGANDFYFFIADEGESFLTSNRPGSMTFRDQTCCNDIYLINQFLPPKPEYVTVSDTIALSIQQDILELLPLSLYFDNDHPDPRSQLSHTTLTYSHTNSEYIKQRQRFINEYSRGLEGFAKHYAITEMEDFFDSYVEAGYKKLDILSDFLYQDLKSGSNVTLKVRGFTSPLTSAEYNIILAKRRISSLLNYFRTWNDGVLSPFMDFTSENGATFRIIEEPSGEALANPFVSDNPLDRQKSVYSKAASLERRIEILIYESDFRKYVNIDENVPVIYIHDNLVQLYPFIGQSDREVVVQISNPGKVPLKIFRVETSSPRLVILSYPEIIPSGKTDQIYLSIRGKLEQAFTEFLIIYSNSAEERSAVYFSTQVRTGQ
jgi:hypothetical protein